MYVKKLSVQPNPVHPTYTLLGNYINAGIWSALEPNMAVVCACIPSLRPLVTIVTQGVFNHPLVRSTLKSSGGASSKRTWGSSKGKSSDGTFSHYDEVDDLQPLGHDVSVRGGRGEDGQSIDNTMDMPQHGIKVMTEVQVSTTDRLDYNDRLY